MNIHPIRTEADYREALATIDAIWPKATAGTPEGDHLDVLITLVQAYERDHYPMLPPDPIEAIKFRVDQMGIGRKGLEGIIGSRARVAEVLAGTRALSIAMIRRLHRELNIPADILIQEIRKPAPKRARAGASRKAGAKDAAKPPRRAGASHGRTEKRVA